MTVTDTIKRRKLQLFGHICRIDNKRSAKQNACWEDQQDDISDWCSCNLPDAVHLTRDKWNEMISKVTRLMRAMSYEERRRRRPQCDFFVNL